MDTYSEQHRHQCEVRTIIRGRVRNGSAWAHEHLDGVAKKRGQEAAKKLKDEVMRQWQLGNRGENGNWAE